ncbi:MAG: hypothetical protein V3581_02550 [Candidatus Cardinium sp.]|nr:hypothetical protein [Candidatus Cardinium sp. TP]MDN5247489.1 hypothetical protein [Candidatus Cardinium sp.]
MQKRLISYRFLLWCGVFIWIAGTCKKNKPVQTGKLIHPSGFVSDAKPILLLSHQRPAGIPNRDGTCYINAILQVIAAFYWEEVMACGSNALRTVVEKINCSPHASIAKDEIQLFIDSLPEMYKNASHRGGDVVQFLNALDRVSPFLPEIVHVMRFFRQEKGTIKSYACKLPMPFILLYPPLDRGFRMERPIVNDLTNLIRSNQEAVVLDDAWLADLYYNGPLFSYEDKLNDVDLPPFVLKHQHWLSSPEGAVKPMIMQYAYADLPNKLAVSFARPGSKWSTTYDHSDLSGAEVIAIHQTTSPYVIRFRLAAFIVAVPTTGPKPDHAIAFVERKGQWYGVSDEIVMPIAYTDAIQASRQARVLFYHKVNQSKPCNPNL